MESFFGTLKTELVRQREYPDPDAARRDLFASIDGYDNRRPIRSAIGHITPNRQTQERINRVSTFPGKVTVPEVPNGIDFEHASATAEPSGAEDR